MLSEEADISSRRRCVLSSDVTCNVGSTERSMDDWTKSYTKEGNCYYLSHKHLASQWDHPEYIRIMKEVCLTNTVRYAAYRTALKLRHLQKQMKCDEISLHCITSAFESAGLRSVDNCTPVSVKAIERIVQHIYKGSFKNNSSDVSLCADLMMNMILNSFDENRNGVIQVLKVKILLTVMVGGRLQEKYRYLFNQISDCNNVVSRRTLAKLLYGLSSIMELLCEHLSFGSNLVTAAVESCFRHSDEDTGITEAIFLDWLLQEPQTLVWWSTLYRLSSSEHACHYIRCEACKTKPIVGLRYRCLKCLGFNLCQNCFLHDRTSRRHKLSHPTHEYCSEPTGKEIRKSLIKTFNLKMGRINLEVKPRYLTISSSSGHTLKSLLQDSTEPQENEELSSITSVNRVSEFSDEDRTLWAPRTSHTRGEDSKEGVDGGFCSSDSSCRSSGTSSTGLPISPRRQIHSVIKKLEHGQRKLASGMNDDRNCQIEKYRWDLRTQINVLKSVLPLIQTHSENQKIVCKKRFPLKELNTMESSTPIQQYLPLKKGSVTESTPIHFLPLKKAGVTDSVRDRVLHLSLSPIGGGTEILDNKENHYNESLCGTPSAMRRFGKDKSGEGPHVTVSEGESRCSEDEDKCILIKNHLRVRRFSEITLGELSIESVHSESPSDPSFEFHTLQDSEANWECTGVDEEGSLERYLASLDQEFSKAEEQHMLRRNIAVGSEEVLDSFINVLELIISSSNMQNVDTPNR